MTCKYNTFIKSTIFKLDCPICILQSKFHNENEIKVKNDSYKKDIK